MNEELQPTTLVEDLNCAVLAAEELQTTNAMRAAAQLAVMTSLMQRSH